MAINSDSGKNSTTVKVFLIVAFWFAGLSVFLFVERQTLPLIYAKIPESTIDFFENIFKKGSDFHIRYIKNPTPEDWLNNKNYGDLDSSGFKSLHDTNFIVYYNDSPAEIEKALLMLKIANSAIPSLASLFGKYYYPADVNHKKLPIYVANSQTQFGDLIRRNGSIVSDEQVLPWLGVYLSEYSQYGTKPKCIVMSPNAWKYDPAKTLEHEMAHYVYFNRVNYSRKLDIKLWVSEGVAEFYSNNSVRLSEANYSEIANFHLNQDMQNINAYWVGMSVFTYLDSAYTLQKVKKFISETIYRGSDEAFMNSLNTSSAMIEPGWKEYVKKLTLNK